MKSGGRLLNREVHRASKKKLVKKKVDVSASWGALGVRPTFQVPHPELPLGRLRQFFFFTNFFFLTRVTHSAEKGGTAPSLPFLVVKNFRADLRVNEKASYGDSDAE